MGWQTNGQRTNRHYAKNSFFGVLNALVKFLYKIHDISKSVRSQYLPLLLSVDKNGVFVFVQVVNTGWNTRYTVDFVLVRLTLQRDYVQENDNFLNNYN